MEERQKHLKHSDQINLGSFYTPKHLVKIAYSLIKQHIQNLQNYIIADTSCGYGSFLSTDFASPRQFIGADIDPVAIERARISTPNATFFNINALQNVNRAKLNLSAQDRLIIIGNPPYNDTTSLIRQQIKSSSKAESIDHDIKTRDFGMSFLLSYNKLQADYICVLHPLSYLIKKANFSTLQAFFKHYSLIDALVVSSHEFSDTSRGMAFPIIIALYHRGKGMVYSDIASYGFQTKEGPVFRLNSLDSIANYITKYPNRQYLKASDKPLAKFYTMRDINALRRSRTFIDKDMANTIYIPQNKFAYYCYVDVFKRRYLDQLPYYVGNCDLMIDNQEFQKIKECFVSDSIANNSILKKHFTYKSPPNSEAKIDNYFKNLLGAFA